MSKRCAFISAYARLDVTEIDLSKQVGETAQFHGKTSQPFDGRGHVRPGVKGASPYAVQPGGQRAESLPELRDSFRVGAGGEAGGVAFEDRELKHQRPRVRGIEQQQ